MKASGVQSLSCPAVYSPGGLAMKYVGRMALSALLLLAAAAAGQNRDDKDGWVNLLEGNDLTRNWTTAGNWKLDKDGVVSLEPRPGETGWARFDAYLWAK